MSKIGRLPIPIPLSVTVEVKPSLVTVKGGKGELSHAIPRGVSVQLADGVLTVTRESDSKHNTSLHGVTRATLANLVKGVGEGFTKDLELVGTGYRARMQGNTLVLSLGFSHEVQYNPPAGVVIQVEGTNLVHLSGPDKHMVGQAGANIRAFRPPEPYKGKGIRYVGEIVRRKAGKAAKAASA